MSGWEEATTVQKVSTDTYSCTLLDDWCIGNVPNGGYVTGCLLEAVKTHFNTALAKQNQPHTIALHVEFLRRTQAGPALFTVKNVKLGRQTSVVHVTMEQDGLLEIAAYATNSNMDTEDGVSYDTTYELLPPPPPADPTKLEAGLDPLWEFSDTEARKFRKATAKVKGFLPRAGPVKPNILDEWICWKDGRNFTQSSLAFAADMFPSVAENFKTSKKEIWYPTLLLNLDFKKSLPAEGVKWLNVRVELKKVKNGRMDYGVWIFDEAGDLIALSTHVALLVDMSRNTAARKKPDSKI